MPEFAVSTRIGALDKFSAVFANFSKETSKMADNAEGHFGRAKKAMSMLAR